MKFASYVISRSIYTNSVPKFKASAFAIIKSKVISQYMCMAGMAFFLAIANQACTSYKKIPYFKDLKTDSVITQSVQNYEPLKIQTADILGINVTSRNPESSAIFNYNLNRANGNMYDQSADNPVTGYIVDLNGNINLPMLGQIHAAALTTADLQTKITELLLKFYKDPVVNVRILNFKIAIFGDVQKPDIYSLSNERTTITQALALAGDLNITAMRNQIFLIREQDGKRLFIPIDLTSKKLFESPYYYLKNNDEIYVQPDRTKYATVDRGYRITTLVLSGLSIIAIVLSNLYR